MTNYYLITIFIVLLTGVKAANKAQPGTRHLLDQGATALREGQLTHQRSGGLGCDVRAMGIHGFQSHLRVEPAQLTK
jgi:hypothetical protein